MACAELHRWDRYLLGEQGRGEGKASNGQTKNARDTQSTHAPTVRKVSLQIQAAKTCVFPGGGSVVGIVGFGGDRSRLEAA